MSFILPILIATRGGPRADAGAADSTTTPQQAIEKATADGDDLNVVPETFKPAVEAQNNQLVRTGLPLQPPDRVEGRFAAAELQPGGWYQQPNDSMVSTTIGGIMGPGRPPVHPRDSFDSNFSAGTIGSVYMPRRVESIMGEEDRKKYAMAQASQRAAGGAYFTGPPVGHIYELSEAELHKAGWKESVESLGGYNARPPHGRNNSYNSVASGDGTSPAGTPALEAPPTMLALPPAASTGTGSNQTRRSPLARVSLVRTVSNEHLGIELEDQTRQTPNGSPILHPQPSHPPSRPGSGHGS